MYRVTAPYAIRRLVRRGKSYVYLQDPTGRSLVQLTPFDYEVVSALDGRTTANDVAEKVCEQLNRKIPAEELKHAFDRLVKAGVIEWKDSEPDGTHLSRREALRHIAASGAATALAVSPIANAAEPTITERVDELTMPEKGMISYGKKAIVRFDANRCIHVRACVLQEPSAFKANVKRWIDADATDPESLSMVAFNCASGALIVKRLDGGLQEKVPMVNTVAVRENGPLAFRGQLVIGGKPDGFRATLCRCGASANKPYCDGSHKKSGFSATGEPSFHDSVPLAQRNGNIEVVPEPDGPLLVSGNIEIISGTGKTIDRLQSATLCRCGASENKPYCDGSHKTIGFKTL